MNPSANHPLQWAWLMATVALLGGRFGAVAADADWPFQPFIRHQTNGSWIASAFETNLFKSLLKDAENGKSAAQVAVGSAYQQGRVVAFNAVEAATWFRKAAEQGNAAGQFKFGSCLLTGHGVATDHAEAFGWIRKSAEQDHTPSFTWLARFYDKGLGAVATNLSEALRWYLRAADSSDDWAQYRLGALYAEGQAVTRDAVEALKWYELASKEGKQFAKKARVEGEALAARLSVPEVVEARRRASTFVPNVLRTATGDAPGSISSAVLPEVRGRDPAAQMTIEAPMELRHNRPIVSARVNDSKPLRFLFDSGTGMSILTERAASKLKLKPSGKKVRLGPESVDTVEGLSINLAGASYSPRSVALHPMKSARMWDPFLEGVLGTDLLNHFVVELDYRAKRIRLRELSKYKYAGPGENLLMRFDKGCPWIDATIVAQDGRTVKGQFLIDTGASGSLHITSDFANEHSLNEAGGNTLGGRAFGFSGTEEIRIGRFKNLHVAHFLIDGPEVTFGQEGRAGFYKPLSGSIGGEILRRFSVTFHYGRQQLSLEPNGLSPKPAQSRILGSELLN